MTLEISPIRLLYVDMELAGARRTVGRLVLQRGRILFEYDPDFVAGGRSISPLKLPLERRIFPGELDSFDGLHGVFNDSLPDGWGRLILDRKLSTFGVMPAALSPLDRLAYVGSRGLGALRYRPEHIPERTRAAIDLDRLAEQIREVLDGDAAEVLDRLVDLGGSSGGARPKVLVGCNRSRGRLLAGVDALPAGYSHWLVKFRSSVDPPDIGAIEYAYSEMARAAGVDMAPTHLFPARSGPGYFGTQRFDRDGDRRVHVHTVCGLLHADHRLPSIDYATLLKATRLVTRNQVEVDRMFRRMVFNVLAHNRDDHTKNHAFLLDADGEWRCTPAYDVTFSSGPGGEHALALGGEGRRPGVEHIAEVARSTGVDDKIVQACVEQARAAVESWPRLASAAGVSRASAALIDARLNGPRKAAGPRRPTGRSKAAAPRRSTSRPAAGPSAADRARRRRLPR
jgi:serine/threonine-protein kinase HipA